MITHIFRYGQSKTHEYSKVMIYSGVWYEETITPRIIRRTKYLCQYTKKSIDDYDTISWVLLSREACRR